MPTSAIGPSTAVLPTASTATVSQTVTLKMQGGYGYQSFVLPGAPAAPNDRGTTTLSVNTTALAELGRAGVDLNVPGVHIFKQKFAVDQVSMRARDPNAEPIAPELGKLVFEVRQHDTMRRNQDPPEVSEWNRVVGLEFWGYTFADFALVWERPQEAGGRVELFSFRSGAPLTGNLEFSLQDLLVASCAALGKPVPRSTADNLPAEGLRKTIAEAKADGAISAEEASKIVTSAEAGGIDPAKSRLVEDTFEKTPIVSWSGVGANPKESPVLSHGGSTVLRAFLMNHQGFVKPLTDSETEMLRSHPLPRPPDHPDHPLSYVCGGSPDYNIPHQSPLMFAAAEDQIWVHGGPASLTISTPGGTLSFSNPNGALKVGETYEGGPEIVSGGRGGGGYLMNKGGRFKVHELELDPKDGTIRRAVLSWVALTFGGFDVPLGVSPGHLVYSRPPLPESVTRDETWKALVAALNDRGRYDPAPLFKILSKRGYIDDSERTLLKALRREFGVGLTSKVDLALTALINASGVVPLMESGALPIEIVQNVMRNCEFPGRSPEYIEEGRGELKRALQVLQGAVAAGYALTDDDKKGLAKLSQSSHADSVRPLLKQLSSNWPPETVLAGLLAGSADPNVVVPEHGGLPLWAALLANQTLSARYGCGTISNDVLKTLLSQSSLSVDLSNPAIARVLGEARQAPALAPIVDYLLEHPGPLPANPPVTFTGAQAGVLARHGVDVYRYEGGQFSVNNFVLAPQRSEWEPPVALDSSQIVADQGRLAFVPRFTDEELATIRRSYRSEYFSGHRDFVAQHPELAARMKRPSFVYDIANQKWISGAGMQGRPVEYRDLLARIQEAQKPLADALAATS